MEIMNGYSIIASIPVRDGLRIILGALTRGDVTSYVTAVTTRYQQAEWWWGHYFETTTPRDELRTLQDALDDLTERVGEPWRGPGKPADSAGRHGMRADTYTV